MCRFYSVLFDGWGQDILSLKILHIPFLQSAFDFLPIVQAAVHGIVLNIIRKYFLLLQKH